MKVVKKTATKTLRDMEKEALESLAEVIRHHRLKDDCWKDVQKMMMTYRLGVLFHEGKWCCVFGGDIPDWWPKKGLREKSPFLALLKAFQLCPVTEPECNTRSPAPTSSTPTQAHPPR